MAQTMIFDTEQLAQAITGLGLPVAFSSYRIAPAVVNYEFNLLNPRDLPKVKRTMACLEAVIHKDIKIIPTKTASFAIAIPRDERNFPKFADYHKALQGKPPGEILFGIDTNGEPVTRNITKTKSILIAGASGGGKSVCLSNIICSIMCYSKPEECAFVLIDLKRVEFELFKNSHHLALPVQFDYEGAYDAITRVRDEIDRRYKSMQEQGIRKATIDKYPLLITVIDEYAMLASGDKGKELDKIIGYIASTGRACNIFIIVATQHAISTIISNTIKSNLQSRIGLRTTNVAQSACILGTRDCIDLLGYGDSYAMFDGVAGLQRIQTCFLSDEDIGIIFKNVNELAEAKNATKTKQKKQTHQNKPKRGLFKRIFGETQGNTQLKHKRPRMTAKQPYLTEELNFINCAIDDDEED